MSQLYRNGGRYESRNEPIEAPANITSKQIRYIEILANDLGIQSLASRNAHILSIIGHSFDNDIYFLSRTEGSLVIDTFKKWLAEKLGERK